MISDVLFEACQDIRKYQNEEPEMYKEMADEIDSVLTAMDELRAKLDEPPNLSDEEAEKEEAESS